MMNVFESFVELSGDGKVSDDFCLKGGLARIGGTAVVVMGTVKGHTPGDMKAANYGELKINTQRLEVRRTWMVITAFRCLLGELTTPSHVSCLKW